jgi:hypothetical protein
VQVIIALPSNRIAPTHHVGSSSHRGEQPPVVAALLASLRT